MRNTIVFLALVATLVTAPPTSARRRHHHEPRASASADFDYWVLSLSWSPEHCAERVGPPDDPQCGVTRHYAFVAHGLWPQYAAGGFPESCPTDARLDADVVRGIVDVMPSESLVRHEWTKHGACSGMPPDRYFALVRRAFERVAIPGRWTNPPDAFRVSASDVRSAFRAANPGLPDGSLAVVCNGSYFTELRVCLAKDGTTPRECGRDVGDRCRGVVTVRPVR